MSKGRVPVAGSREFGRKTRGKPVPPTRRKAAKAPLQLSPAESAQERIEELQLRKSWLRRSTTY